MIDFEIKFDKKKYAYGMKYIQFNHEIMGYDIPFLEHIQIDGRIQSLPIPFLPTHFPISFLLPLHEPNIPLAFLNQSNILLPTRVIQIFHLCCTERNQIF